MSWWRRLFGRGRSPRLTQRSSRGTQRSSRGFDIDRADSLLAHLPPGTYQVSELERAASLLGWDVKKLDLTQLTESWKRGRPEWPDWNYQDAVELGYKTSAWVFACCYRLSKAIAGVPWRMERRVDSDDWEPLEDGGSHPLQQLWDSPNPHSSGVAMRERQVLHLMLGGNAVLAKNRATDSSPPGELWAWAPDKVVPVPGRDGTTPVDAYAVFLDGMEVMRLPPEEVVHHMLPDPCNPRWGMPPMQAAARPADSDIQGSEWQVRSFANDARPSLVISHARDLSPQQHAQAKAKLREDIQGPQNAGVPLLLGHSAQVQVLSMSPREMDFMESRRMSREEICAVFGTPPPMIGIYDNATYSNFENARLVWWVDTITPFLASWAETINRQLVKDFGDPEELRLWYDLRNVEALRPQQKQQEERGERLWKMGVPLRRVNSHLNLGLDLTDVPSADVSFVPSTMVPAGELTNEAPGTEAELEVIAGGR